MKLTFTPKFWIFWLLAGLGAEACSGRSYRLGKGSEDDPPTNTASGGTAAGTTGSAAAGGASGVAGTISIPGGAAGTSGGSLCDPDAGCLNLSFNALTRPLSTNVVLAVDTTATPADKLQAIELELNSFAQSMASYWIDLRLVVLAAEPGFCVPAPLGSGACAPQGADTLLPTLYHHPSAVVDDGNALQVVMEQYPIVRFQFDPNGLSAVPSTLIVVTGGDAAAPWTDPAAFVQSYRGMTLGDWRMAAYYPFTQCVPDTREGRVYRDIVTQTGGEHADMCTESAQAAFERFARSIVDRVVPCNIGLRDPGQGRMLDPTKINVQVRTPGAQQTIPKVVSVEDCDGLIEGWYYDNDSTPVEIRLCPASCTLVRQTRDAEIDVLVGCPTIPPAGCN